MSPSKEKPAAARTAEKVEEKADQPTAPVVPSERYFWVEWGPKAHKHDSETIRIWVQGVGRRWNRGVAVIAPESYLKAADNAQEPRFSMVPGEGMKKLTPIPRAPYKILFDRGQRGEATEAEFREMLEKGNAARRAANPAGQPVLP